jgi:ferredoxin
MVCSGCEKEVKIRINKDKCVGCGMCASLNPDVFEIVNGKARVKKEKVNLFEVQEIVENCPMQAIEIEEEN